MSQIRDEDVVVRQKICEMLVVLTRTHHGRELMRNRNVYPIVREMHEDTTKKVNRLLRSLVLFVFDLHLLLNKARYLYWIDKWK